MYVTVRLASTVKKGSGKLLMTLEKIGARKLLVDSAGSCRKIAKNPAGFPSLPSIFWADMEKGSHSPAWLRT
jgi:hypothetical protein